MRHGHRAGNIRFAQSSSLNASDVTANAINAAFRAWTKGSRSDLVNAAIRTLERVPTPKFLEILPKQIVVFVRIPGCSSFEVLARYFSSSPLMVLSDNFPMTVNTALTVCSLTTGATSVNPLTYSTISYRNILKYRRAYHLRENLVIDYFLWQSINHYGQVIKQANPNSPIWTAEESYDCRRDLNFKFVVC